MDAPWKNILWRQFGASIDMLENALRDCPEEMKAMLQMDKIDIKTLKQAYEQQ